MEKIFLVLTQTNNHEVKIESKTVRLSDVQANLSYMQEMNAIESCKNSTATEINLYLEKILRLCGQANLAKKGKCLTFK